MVETVLWSWDRFETFDLETETKTLVSRPQHPWSRPWYSSAHFTPSRGSPNVCTFSCWVWIWTSHCSTVATTRYCSSHFSTSAPRAEVPGSWSWSRGTPRPLLAVLVFAKWSCLHQSCPWVGLTHGLGWVGSGWVTQNGPMDNSGLHHCSFITPSFNNSEHPFWMFYQWLTMGFLLEFLHYISRDVSTV